MIFTICVQKIITLPLSIGDKIHGGSQTKYSVASENLSSRQWWRLKGFQDNGYICSLNVFHPLPISQDDKKWPLPWGTSHGKVEHIRNIDNTCKFK